MCLALATNLGSCGGYWNDRIPGSPVSSNTGHQARHWRDPTSPPIHRTSLPSTLPTFDERYRVFTRVPNAPTTLKGHLRAARSSLFQHPREYFMALPGMVWNMKMVVK